MSLSSQVNSLATAIGNYFRDNVLPRLLPSGGSVGQVLTKTSGAAYAASWQDVSGGASSANTASLIASGAAVTLHNNCRTRDANSSLVASLQQLSSNPSAAAPTSWTVDPSNGGCVFNYSGGNAQLTGSGVWFPSVTYNSSTGQADLWWRAETETDSSVLVVSLTSWSGVGPRIIVDGTYYSTEGLINTSGVSVGSQMWLRINFPDGSKRKVSIEGRYDIRLISVATAGDGACTRPANNGSRMVFLGDSNAWMFGYDLKGASYALTLADCLGIQDVRLSAVSGTGLQATNGGANYNYLQRIADVIGVTAVDIVVIAMSWNDWNYGSGWSAAQIKTAAASLITSIRSTYPEAVILFHGVNNWDIAAPDEIGLDGHEAAVQEAVAESSDPLVGFIAVRSAAGNPILYGGSTTSGTHANRYVNTSIDHMTPDGNNYVGRWLADRVFTKLVELSGSDAPAILEIPKTFPITEGDDMPIGAIEVKNVAAKASIANQTTGLWASLWRATGYPTQGGIPTAAALCTNATAGAHTLSVSATGTQYVADFTLRSVNSGMLFQLCDRIAHMGGLSGTVTTAQNVLLDLATLAAPSARVGLADYTEIDWWLEWYTDTGATAVNVTVNVTYSDLSTGNLNNISLAATRRASTCYRLSEYIPTAKAGLGIKGVNTVTLSATTGTAGNFGVTATRMVFEVGALLANYPHDRSYPQISMPDVQDTSCLEWRCLNGTSTTGTLNASFRLLKVPS